ncbi:hypothetical protein VPNG_03417 [Cytospora leucostoma]|uniref:Uncharacterized protein n=1 Tax=Cytospora leucostoma TaxID=1230097 RepID=A0A423XFW5_9PEZI|nr:hypothetical protein VPNG_03417 [Cytospora leucostoma]
MAESIQGFQALLEATIEQNPIRTNITKSVHRSSYPAIDPTRPELSQDGRTVLITGGGTGIGFAIASSFVQAGAKAVIIAGRRENVLTDAKKQLDKEAQKASKATKIIAHVLDVTDKPAVIAFWSGLKEDGIEVDVLILNAAKFAPLNTILEIGSDEIWSMFEANVHGPLVLAEAFAKQGGNRPKSLVNVATQSIHQFDETKNIIASKCPAYGLTKNAGTLTIQQIALHTDPEKLQIVSFHPGVVYTDGWRKAGVPEAALPFDDVSLAGSAAVWLASAEARFLHGRFVWASWDVEELKTGELRQKIDEDVEFLKLGLVGVTSADRAW